MERECIGCGCLFKPLLEDIKCPHCGGGRGEITKTPMYRIRELQDKVESLEMDLETFSSNSLKRTEQLQDAIKKLKQKACEEEMGIDI